MFALDVQRVSAQRLNWSPSFSWFTIEQQRFVDLNVNCCEET